MRNLLKKLRGILGIGITCAIGWALVGALVSAIQALIIVRSYPQAQGTIPGTVVVGAVFFGIYGFLVGALSGLILSVVERRRTLSELTTGRFALWGAIAGAAVPGANILLVRLLEGGTLSDGSLVTIVSSCLGAVSSAALLKIARSGTSNGSDSHSQFSKQTTASIQPPDDTAARVAADLSGRPDGYTSDDDDPSLLSSDLA